MKGALCGGVVFKAMEFLSGCTVNPMLNCRRPISRVYAHYDVSNMIQTLGELCVLLFSSVFFFYFRTMFYMFYGVLLSDLMELKSVIFGVLLHRTGVFKKNIEKITLIMLCYTYLFHSCF